MELTVKCQVIAALSFLLLLDMAGCKKNNVTPVAPYGTTITIAGIGSSGSANGIGISASFVHPGGVALDAAGNLYVADAGNNLIRKITPAGVVTTFAGSGQVGYADGTGTAATFNTPIDVAVDKNGNVYVADAYNDLIRKITPAGVVTTLAGSGYEGHADGSGAAASFRVPTGLAVDGNGNVYVADQVNNEIRKITPQGAVSTLAGNLTFGADNGTGAAASFFYPGDVAVDGSGNVYVADYGNYLVRKITPDGAVSTYAGSGIRGTADGNGTAAQFQNPISIAVTPAGILYLTDFTLIRKISDGGIVTTVAGNTSTIGSTDGVGAAASFTFAWGMAADATGYLFVSDYRNDLIRKIIVQ